MKKFFALLLALAMVLSLCACGGSSEKAEETAPAAEAAPEAPVEEAPVEEAPAAEEAAEEEEIEIDPYSQASSDLYAEVLGEYYQTYMAAKETKNISERYALMALAEGKLMEAALMLPTTTRGGLYAITRVAPYTNTPCLWGNDEYRFHNRLVTNELIKSEDYAEMRAKYSELVGTGTYYDWVKGYLEEKGYTLKDTLSIGYTSDPITWDVLATSRAAESEAIINTYDGLYEYDSEVALQPALATSYDVVVNDDGTQTYTFHLREGVKWVDSQGREVADLKADDFVAGMNHMLEAGGGLEYLVCADGGCGIVGTDAYVNGETTDFETVGVKALDDLTVEYTLVQECPFFMTMLGYGVFAPMSREYFLSQGGGFGEDYNPEDASYAYGKDPDHIAYCGPYLVTNNTAESTIVFKANESYWNAENTPVKTIIWLFNDGSDPLKAYNDTMSGVLDGANLTASALEVARKEGNFDKYSYISRTDATSYMGFFNINRAVFANVADPTTVVSPQTEEQAARTQQAMRNVHFRRAVSFGVDRGAYNAQGAGEDLKYNALRNCYTPGTFVVLSEDVTVDINGTPTEFKAGTFYGEIMQAQIDADGVTMKVWDDELMSSDGFDGWYNVDAAKAELAQAIEELGIEISAENPIYIDLPTPMNSEVYRNERTSFKKSVEDALEGAVIVNLTECVDYEQWYYAGYYTDYGYEANYDVYDLSGWGPDYGDPATYLDTFLPDYSGYMIKCIGIF